MTAALNETASLAQPVSLLALVRAIRAGELTPLAAFDRLATRAAAVEPSILAFAAENWEAARKTVEARAERPLAGLPVGLKDIVDTSFLPTEYGSRVYAGHQPAGDAALVGLLAEAGATFPVKTTTTEFAHMEPTETRNPWAPARSPGGSSSGSAAAVAAGMLPAATGSQTGGSTVRPGSFCGIVGFKPTFDRLPFLGMKPFSPSFDTVGLFTADVASMRYLFAALEGPTPPLTAPVPETARIAVLHTPWDNEAAEASNFARDTAAKVLARAGFALGELTLPESVAAADAIHTPLGGREALLVLAAERLQTDRMGAKVAQYLKEADAVDDRTFEAAKATATAAKAAAPAMFDGIDALLTFAAVDVAPPDRTTTGSARFNRLWTILGLPALSVPGLMFDGLPIGVQLVSAPGNDEALLALSERVEALLRSA